MSNEVKKTAMHPAWQCAHRKLTNVDRWNDYEDGLPGGYYDSQIALAMIVGGFGADVVVTERDEEGNPTAYKFPDVWVTINEDAGRRMGPSLRFMREVHGEFDAPTHFPLSELQYVRSMQANDADYARQLAQSALNGRR